LQFDYNGPPSVMTYYIAIKGVKKDPMSEETVRAMIATGEIGVDALCWREGWSNWQPVPTAFPELFPGHALIAPVTAPSSGAAPASSVEAEAIRKEHIHHEASIRSVGTLYLLGSALLIFAGIASLAGLNPDKRPPVSELPSWFMPFFFITLACIQFQVGRWLRALNPKARTPATVLAILGLFAFPLGTLINAYILYLLRSKKGATVFSESYCEVVKATPQIKYKTSIIIWILLGLVVLMLGLAAFGAWHDRHHI
jgi:hypothetical protein